MSLLTAPHLSSHAETILLSELLAEKFTRIPTSLKKAFVLIGAYALWVLLLRLLCLSLVVYFLTRHGHTAKFEEINDTFSNNEIIFVGLSAGLFLMLLKGLAPLLGRETALEISFSTFQSSYLPGFLQGALLAASIVLAFTLVGSLRFVGFFVQIEDTSLAIMGIVARIAALLAIGLCEETLFRCEALSIPFNPLKIISVALFYCVVKLAQFDLSWMHLLTLFLFSVTLSTRRLNEKNPLGGAAFWSALLIVFHPLLSLPIFGSDFSGVLMLKYQVQPARIASMINGGAGGPLSSIALQIILLIEIVRGLLAYKKTLLKPSPNL